MSCDAHYPRDCLSTKLQMRSGSLQKAALWPMALWFYGLVALDLGDYKMLWSNTAAVHYHYFMLA